MKPEPILDTVNQAIEIDSKRVQLTPKAFAVLEHLRKQPDRLVGKDELLETVWPNVYVGDAVLKVAVREIRKALDDSPREPRYIETVHRRGYRFIGQLAVRQTITAPAAIPIANRLAGRNTQLNQLIDYWHHAVRGQPQLIFINGPAGIGKSSLIEESVTHITHTEPCLFARGYCLENKNTAEAYFPILDALAKIARHPLGKNFKPLLARYAPGWLWQMPWLIEQNEQSALQQQLIGSTPQRMIREMAELLAALSAEAPLLLILEDMHWSDNASLDLLSYLARWQGTGRWLIAATVRSGAVAEGERTLRRLQEDLSNCHSLQLGSLSSAALEQYLQQRCPGVEGELATLLEQRCDGHPLFITAVVDTLIADGILVQRQGQWSVAGAVALDDIALPDELRQILQRQFDRLTTKQRRLLGAASVVRKVFAAEALAAMLESDVGLIEDQCEQLVWDAHWLKDAESREWPDGSVSALYGFRHALYREFVYQQLTAARCQRYHKRLALRLEIAYRGHLNGIAADLAYHFERGGDKRKALHYCRMAAEVDKARFAPREALRHIEHAVLIIEAAGNDADLQAQRQDFLLSHCELLQTSGQLPAANQAYRQLAELAAASNSLACQVKALLGLAQTLFWLDRQQCLAVARQALILVRDVADPVLQAHVEGWHAHWHSLIQGYQPEHDQAYQTAVKLTRNTKQLDWACQHTALLAYLQNLRADYTVSCDTAEAGRELAVQIGDGQHYLVCQFFRAWALFYAGRWGEMLATMEDGYLIAAKNGHLPWLAHFQLQQAWLNVTLYDFPQAAKTSAAVLEQMEAKGFYGSEFFLSAIIQARALLGLQQLDAVGICLEQITRRLDQAPDSIDWVLRLPWQYTLADYHLAQGAAADAMVVAQNLYDLAQLPGETTYTVLALAQIAESALIQGHSDAALKHLQQAESLVAHTPVAAARVNAQLAKVYALQGQPGQAKSAYTAASAALAKLAHSLAQYPQQQKQFQQAAMSLLAKAKPSSGG